MSNPKPSATLKHREYYDRAADAVPEFTVLNYGFSSDPEVSVIAGNEPEFYCLRLYEHTVRDTPLAGRDVLEVSCGRGGGASFVSRTFGPRRYVGLDLSAENIRLARERAAREGLTFATGHAERNSGAAVKPCGAHTTPDLSTPHSSATLSASASSAVSDADVAVRAATSLNIGLHPSAVNPFAAVAHMTPFA